MSRVLLYTDGAARGNPGPAAIGAVLYREDEDARTVLEEVSEAIGKATNNEAEYLALIAGLEAARRLGVPEVIVRADSLLLVNQLNGAWRLKAPHLRPLYQRARTLMRSFGTITIEHVRREENVEADALANAALDR